MKPRYTFARALAFWFIAGMTTYGALSRVVKHWQLRQELTHYGALCSLAGGTLVHSGSTARCLACERPRKASVNE